MTALGVSPGFSSLHATSFLVTSAIGISLVVFINAAQAFVLTDILHVPNASTGKISGTLIFAEEVLVLCMVLVWGRLADATSPRLVATLANLLAGLGLLLFVQAKNVFPQLLLARLLFACGAAGITAMLSALLSILSSPPSLSSTNERQPILGWSRPSPEPSGPKVDRATKLAAYLGFSTGLGALLAVFVYLRLPTILSQDSATGLKYAFRIVACIAFSNALLAFIGLPRVDQYSDRVKPGYGGILAEIAKLGRGFRLATKTPQLALGFIASFAARAQVITVSVFIPLYVASYYQKTGLCKPIEGEPLKTGCRAAYALASAITGSIQLVTLLFSPFLSFTCHPSLTLFLTFAIGALSFLLLGRSTFSLGGEDPRNVWTWLATLGIGVSQISGIVLSLVLVAGGRKILMGENGKRRDGAESESDSEDGYAVDAPASAVTKASSSGLEQEEEIAGALAGASSFCGGLAILFVSGIGGLLADKRPGIPFVLVAVLDLVVGILALVVHLKS